LLFIVGVIFNRKRRSALFIHCCNSI